MVGSPQHLFVHAVLHISNVTYGIGIWLALICTHEFCNLLWPCKTSMCSPHLPQGDKLQRSSSKTATSSSIKTTSKFCLKVIVGLCQHHPKWCSWLVEGLVMNCVHGRRHPTLQNLIYKGLQLTTRLEDIYVVWRGQVESYGGRIKLTLTSKIMGNKSCGRNTIFVERVWQ
jgi:hypothetical protein